MKKSKKLNKARYKKQVAGIKAVHSPEIVEILVSMAALEAGIAPLNDISTNDVEMVPAVNRLFTKENFEEGEARKTRRKFRKLWRKVAPHLATKNPGDIPTARLMAARKRAVRKHLIDTVVEERLRQISRPEDEEKK
jgi:hypothetical protein